MIKINELRIGNVLSVNGETVKVGIVKENEIAWKIKGLQFTYWNPYISVNDSRLQEVELSAELLLKSGFIECEGVYGTYFKHHEFEGFRVWFFENEQTSTWVVGRKDYETGETHVERNVKSLHMLQNLFYFGTDKELKINL